MTSIPSLPRYDRSQTYRWNYDHAPSPPANIEVPPIGDGWTFCGRPVPSPLGIAAGPLLNGRWILYYAALGFDLLTYKTTRSRPRDCYPLPNLQPVDSELLSASGRELHATGDMQGSWAVSFGMPSMSPDVWRADVEWTRTRLPKEKLLAVSVVASAEADWSLDDLADDFARCARWAVESGADCVETNFSCPNVSTSDGQLYQQPPAAALVAQRVRDAIGKTPFVIKVGFLDDMLSCAELLDAVAPFADALAMTNCIAATVHGPGGAALFNGQPRGIGGDPIRSASVAQVRRFADLTRQRGHSTKIIGVGGISTAAHVQEYLEAGAEAVQLATAPMVNPLVGVQIRSEFAKPKFQPGLKP
ncbi:MAG TPA: tRNA-dihydrouridine synthase [Pirellulaceae bacterium]|nr:tRNA-dihydrouridine synthase [Pirellulaceae bacterium]